MKGSVLVNIQEGQISFGSVQQEGWETHAKTHVLTQRRPPFGGFSGFMLQVCFTCALLPLQKIIVFFCGISTVTIFGVCAY